MIYSIKAGILKLKSNRIRLFLESSSILIIGLICNFYSDWKLIGFWSEEKMFGKDFLYVTQSVTCIQQYDFFSLQIPSNCNYFYGLLLLKILQIFKVNESNFVFYVSFSTFTFLIFVVLFLVSTLRKSSLGTRFFAYIAVFSPFFWTLVYRGNLDQFIFMIVVLSIIVEKKGYIKSAFFLLVLGSLSKFYTVPLLLIFAYRHRFSTARALFWLISFCTLFEILIEFGKLDFSEILKLSSSFGLYTILMYLKLFFNDSIAYVLFVFAFGFGIFIAHLILTRTRFFRILNNIEFDYFTQTLLLVHFSSYLFFVNYDWRLIYCVFGLVWFLSSQTSNYLIFILRIETIVIAWCGSGYNQIAPFGDIALFFLFITFACLIYSKFKSSKFGLGDGLFSPLRKQTFQR